MTLVYSTDLGRIKAEPEVIERPKGDGVVRIHRQTKGRKGKGVSIVTGLDLDDTALKLFAAEIKKKWRKLETKEQVGQHLKKVASLMIG